MKYKKYIVLGLAIFVLVACSFAFIKRFNTHAQSSVTKTFTTKVTVGNSAPTFTIAPAESPVSSTTAPTTPGTAITFSATATDANNENYYLIICSTNAVTAGANGAAPTCTGTQYCVSSSTGSGSVASCSYTTKAADPYTNNWYAFVCDTNTSSSCSTPGNQGSGNSGSPFIVNHAPTFTAISNNSPRDPGQSVTWTSTASDATDGNTVKLLVCKTQAMSNGTCTGGSWCESSLVASNPTCSYTIPNPAADGANNAYVYVVDQFNTPATGTAQNTASNFTINNIAPVVSTVKLNNEATPINLEAGTTKSVSITATVVDDNGCAGGEIASVLAYAYRSGITYTGCDTSGETNANYCYPEIVCNAGACTGGKSVAYTCSVPLQYYADPTDANNVATSFSTQHWLATVKATDNNSATHNATSTATVEVASLAAFEITPSIDYGTVAAGGSTGTLNQTVVTTPTGNVPMNQLYSGTQMCTDSPTCSASGKTPLAVTLQEYALTSGTSYGSGTDLTATPTAVNINVPKVTDGANVTTKTSWWGISIPIGTLPGVYNGVNTITSSIQTT